MQQGTPRQFGLLVMLAAVGVLLVVGGLSIRGWSEIGRNIAEIHEARQILDVTDALFGHIRDAEAGQRGYLLTDDSGYLVPYNQARRAIPGELRRLYDQTARSPDERDHVDRVSGLVSQELAALAETIRLRDSSKLTTEALVSRSDASNQTMDSLRSEIMSIRQAENARWLILMRQRDSLSRETQWLGFVGSAVLAVLLVGAILMVWRGASQRERLIVELNSSHEAVERVRELLQTTLYSIGDAVITTDIGGCVTRMNSVAERLTGWSESEARGRPIAEVFRIVREGSREPAPNPVDTVIQTGQVAGLENHTILLPRSGGAIPIDDSGAPIRNGDETRGVVLVFRDVTARKKAETELRESEERFRDMADAAPVFIWLSGPDKLCTYVNRPWLEFTGRTLEQELGAGWAHSIHSEDAPGAVDLYNHSFDARRPFAMEYRLRRRDGSYRWVLTNGVPRFDRDGSFVGYIGSAIDVEDRRQNEEKLRQSAKLESLGVLAGGIAHDFNNILVGILANAALLEDYIPEDSPARELVSGLSKAGERAAQLTRQMLAYSGRGRFVIEKVNLSDQVRQILGLVHASIPKNVRVRLDLNGELPEVLADSSQLQQLVMNLLINAAEAIAPKPGIVSVSTGVVRLDEGFLRSNTAGEHADPGEFVVLSVSDNGVGMDFSTRARMFDPFFTTKFTGRGLGLAAVQGIVRGHKGAIQVDSALAEGTTFRVFLPVASRPEPMDAAPGAAPALPAARGGRETILVADDEEMVRKTAFAVLEKLGYRVLLSEDGSQALECFARHPGEIQLILLDMTMPVMNGEEVLTRLRSGGHRVKVIASSGYSEAEALGRFGSGIDGFLQKPYTANQIARAVRAALGVSVGSA
jgi:PAS domain S-box-containing protein